MLFTLEKFETTKIKQYVNSLSHCTINASYLCEIDMSCCKNKVLLFLLFSVSSLLSLNSHARGWNHYHGGGWGYGGPGYYPGWGGPNVIINVPIIPAPPRVYVRECETVEICNEYDECWLERQCN